MNKARDCHEVAGLEGRVLVDGFRLKSEEIEAYFLSHFHGDYYTGISASFRGPGLILRPLHGALRLLPRPASYGDHYTGLSATFRGPGLIHCTLPTARLIVQELGVDPALVRGFAYGESVEVCGASVTFLDANHCPGAALLLFRLKHLHTGDMRYHPRMQDYPALIQARGQLENVYLDSTYCHPKHAFCAQEED
ncbi:beta-lactamase-like protein [Baffinella frigidus]|nr:beta-lactamase-like protein [Cryptophyta sp. CCMP2293]